MRQWAHDYSFTTTLLVLPGTNDTELINARAPRPNG